MSHQIQLQEMTARSLSNQEESKNDKAPVTLQHDSI